MNFRLCLVVPVSLCVASATAFGEEPGAASSPRAPVQTTVRIAASIIPLGYIVEEIGGPRVSVVTLLPAGQSPHGFAVTPRQAERLTGCELLVRVGLGLDDWAERAARAARGRELRQLVMGEVLRRHIIGAGGEQNHDHGDDGHDHAHHYGDPHLWLDPVLVKEFAATVAEALGEIDPAHAEEYNGRREAFAAELDALDSEYRETLGAAKRKSFVCFHAAFTYPAARYGLEQAVVMEGNLDEFGVRQLEKVITFIREREVKVIFAEPQQPAERLQTIARQTGARIGWLDPQGNPGQPGRDSYAALMRYNLEQMKAALNE